MKKRLLITSIVMMLVCAVALSTATYAWFTSNASVSASTMTLRAATNSEDALGIGWTGWGAGTAIDVGISQTLNPMAPYLYTVSDNTQTEVPLANSAIYEKASNASNMQFYTSSVKQEAGNVVFNNNGSSENPIIYQTAGDSNDNPATPHPAATSFYIRNLSPANKIDSVTISAVFPTSQWYEKVADTSGTPVANTTYYTRSGAEEPYTYTVANPSGNLASFQSGTDYYILKAYAKAVAPYDSTKTYYTATYSEGVFTYTPAQAGDVNGTNFTNYYEEVSKVTGDDMIRVAIFKKEYRQTTDTTVEADKTYYEYKSTTNVIGAVNLPDNTEGINPRALGYFEVKYSGDDEHTLLGVLGYEATTFTQATGNVDNKNTVYYKFTQVSVVAAESEGVHVGDSAYNYYEAGANNTYFKSSDAKVKSTKTYYTIQRITGEELVTEGAVPNTYYVARNTVANGQITAEKSVRDLNYYTGVTTSITFAYDLLPNEQIDIIAVAWLDGSALDDSRQGEVGQVNLKFKANKEA